MELLSRRLKTAANEGWLERLDLKLFRAMANGLESFRIEIGADSLAPSFSWGVGEMLPLQIGALAPKL